MSTEIGAQVNGTIAGKDYTVRPTFAVLIRAEKRIGSLLALINRLGNGHALTCEEACGVIFEAINAEKQMGITMSSLSAWAMTDMGTLSDAVKFASEILFAGMPKRREDADESPQPAA
jgi:hypothetical protein